MIMNNGIDEPPELFRKIDPNTRKPTIMGEGRQSNKNHKMRLCPSGLVSQTMDEFTDALVN